MARHRVGLAIQDPGTHTAALFRDGSQRVLHADRWPQHGSFAGEASVRRIVAAAVKKFNPFLVAAHAKAAQFTAGFGRHCGFDAGVVVAQDDERRFVRYFIAALAPGDRTNCEQEEPFHFFSKSAKLITSAPALRATYC